MAEMVKSQGATLEQVLIGGDLGKLSPEQRVSYYQAVCGSVGLNPLTRPLEYITLNGKLTLYARKDATDQLRKLNGISIEKPGITFEDDWIIVTVAAHDGNGRSDSDVGVVNKKAMSGDFGNALMKAVTKAKRRVTLSICGLGMLDETEVETIPDARPVPVEIAHELPAPTAHWIDNSAVRKGFWTWAKNQGLSEADVHTALQVEHINLYPGTKDEAKATIEAYIKRNTQPEPAGDMWDQEVPR